MDADRQVTLDTRPSDEAIRGRAWKHAERIESELACGRPDIHFMASDYDRMKVCGWVLGESWETTASRWPL